jgi:FkbM family methyltransferase
MTSYFLLAKESVVDNEADQLIVLNKNLTFILPRNNLNYYADHGLFENTLINWCKGIIGNGVFLDIGAHTGTYAISLADQCKHVYAFEPQKMTYYALCGSVALSNKKNITCYNTGLGSATQVGEQQLKIVSNDGGGSSLHATHNILSEETIEIKTLDSYDITNVTFIKMDVEENELYVLHGALETLLNSNRPKILFESNNTNEPLFTYITQLCYTIVKISGYHNMYLATSN